MLHLAVDIGASSGRHILGYIENGKMKLEEIYRFSNAPENTGGSLIWNTEKLTKEVITGLKKAKETGKIPDTVAIDTWGVDYVLLDKDKKEIEPSYCYRDNRTSDVIQKCESIIPQSELYSRTGIQKLDFNTIYQLYCDKLSGRLENAEYMLMIPAYLSYKLTGVIKQEYTNATTTSLVNVKTNTWDYEIIKKLGLKESLFTRLYEPATEVGRLSPEIENEIGYNTTVVFCPSHDTASAVAACPLEEDSLYISSGTWSLIGRESKTAFVDDNTRKSNFTNEGGIEHRFRFLKNYMGMWLLQQIRKDIGKKLTFDEIMHLAENSEKHYYIDVNDKLFVAPDNMCDAVKQYLKNDSLTLDEISATVYHSLAKSYKNAVCEIEALTKRKITAIHIVGGGCRDDYLNRLTAEYTGKTVTKGPVEATACGNIISQFIYSRECENTEEARDLVKKSFDIKEVNL